MITENHYFEGNVKSLGYETSDGSSTIGVINPGEYQFNTAKHEIMKIIEGELTVLLPDETAWQSFKAGTAFEIPADATFKVKASAQVAYLCQYR
ncbi:pyrimidine/purine nucleoside phosphorylase [Pedobacter sandarakinus]|uniref:pyrimidine/purine nucleoside phosphorylase n=1 Tax=Pedobacter sandarakinus TaxID=353156 RepID=UPI0022454002|nr:pyrimidine/purine nucleoside phosphorylase [Pedobacter sandarakinus]MCX2575026.1 pyrimidine/purine nucleoside phosphorylase [Pedobacter sandarakinus]